MSKPETKRESYWLMELREIALPFFGSKPRFKRYVKNSLNRNKRRQKKQELQKAVREEQ